MKTQKLGVGKSIWACVAFWLLTLFGGAIPMIWNTVSGFLTGQAMYAGSLGYMLLQIASTAIGAALANAAIKSITDDLADVMCIVNMSIAATLMFVLNTINWIQGSNTWQDVIGLYLAVIVYIVGAVMVSNEHKKRVEAAV